MKTIHSEKNARFTFSIFQEHNINADETSKAIFFLLPSHSTVEGDQNHLVSSQTGCNFRIDSSCRLILIFIS